MRDLFLLRFQRVCVLSHCVSVENGVMDLYSTCYIIPLRRWFRFLVNSRMSYEPKASLLQDSELLCFTAAHIGLRFVPWISLVV